MRTVACVLGTLTILLFPAALTQSAQASGPRIDSGERAIVRAINHQRSRFGLRKLHRSARLGRAADRHSWDMLAHDYFAHGSFVARVRRFVRLRRVGETLAETTRCSARLVVSMWMHSPPHRAVLLSRGFRRVGVGRRLGRLGTQRACVVTADFGSGR
jgi:uncharacterized protein YkwD